MSPLHYLSSHSDFGFEFAEIFIFEKRLPAITDTGSRRLRVSVIRGVAKSPDHWYAELPTPRITNTESQLLNFFKENSLYWWYGELLKVLKIDTRLFFSLTPISPICGVFDSPTKWYAESPTLNIVESESRQLHISPLWRVADSMYNRYGESPTLHITDTESRRLCVSLSWGVKDSADRWYRSRYSKKKII